MGFLSDSITRGGRRLIACAGVIVLLGVPINDALGSSSSDCTAERLDAIWEGYYAGAHRDTVEKYIGQLRQYVLTKNKRYTECDVRDRIIPILENYYGDWAAPGTATAKRLGDLIYEIHRATRGQHRNLIESAHYGSPVHNSAVEDQFTIWITPELIRAEPGSASLRAGGSAEFLVSALNAKGDPVPIGLAGLEYRLDPDNLGELADDGGRLTFEAYEETEGEVKIAITSRRKSRSAGPSRRSRVLTRRRGKWGPTSQSWVSTSTI